MNALQRQRAVLAVAAIGLTWAENLNAKINGHFVFDQPSCPLRFVSDRGSTVVIKNVASQRIVSYGLVCFAKRDRKHRILANFGILNPEVEPGEETYEGGFDATPLNVCRTVKGVLGISFVVFADGIRWDSSLLAHPTSSTDLPKGDFVAQP